jgi:hypothetical protein
LVEFATAHLVPLFDHIRLWNYSRLAYVLMAIELAC